MANVLSILGIQKLGESVRDVYEIVNGGGDNIKLLFDLSGDKRMIRFAQRHSVGGGVRPDWLPVETNAQYPIRWASLEASEQITKEGRPRCNRLRIHFYACDMRGHLIGDQDVRCGSDIAIVISAKQCRDGGIVVYRSANK